MGFNKSHTCPLARVMRRTVAIRTTTLCFYNGLRSHRVIPGFVAQGGCPNGNGTGGPGYTIKDELVGNPHKHERGALSMAHRGPNTGGSQFFIVYEPQPHLDGVHTVFGKVIEGMDVVDGIQQGAIMETVEVIEG